MPFLDKVDQTYEIERCRREAWTILKGCTSMTAMNYITLSMGEITYFVEDKFIPCAKWTLF